MAANIDTPAVIDASFMLAYLLPDESLNKVQAAFDRYKSGDLELIAPSLLGFEVTNGILAAVIRKRLDRKVAQKLIRAFAALPISYEEIDPQETFELATAHKLSVYDASYLLLAKKRKAPILTLDKRLARLV